ncbi:hypothetical protein V2H45_24995 [Tumidithrix elongata RA019]|uniref:Integral membrane protein TerC n=1 Tax=Tumidithrix elongata BACA0141 TaxID=2716417 RepID=A0AAW9Q7R2_9CYAN|nr:hypothetical protein [Tumidithrix elongata RA019]
MEQIASYLKEGLSLNMAGVFLALIALEIVLSADNAVALAALVQNMEDPAHQRRALNWGLVFAFGLRALLLLTTTWVIQFWQFELLGALYLLWLAFKHFWERFADSNLDAETWRNEKKPPDSLWQVVPAIALTDLAFSLDSITTAVAISDRLWLVLAGGIMGVIALRFLAGLFVEWLAKFAYLQDAAYLTVMTVGFRLLGKAVMPSDYLMPEWMMLATIAILFSWGFSKQVAPEIQED